MQIADKLHAVFITSLSTVSGRDWFVPTGESVQLRKRFGVPDEFSQKYFHDNMTQSVVFSVVFSLLLWVDLCGELLLKWWIDLCGELMLKWWIDLCGELIIKKQWVDLNDVIAKMVVV